MAWSKTSLHLARSATSFEKEAKVLVFTKLPEEHSACCHSIESVNDVSEWSSRISVYYHTSSRTDY